LWCSPVVAGLADALPSACRVKLIKPAVYSLKSTSVSVSPRIRSCFCRANLIGQQILILYNGDSWFHCRSLRLVCGPRRVAGAWCQFRWPFWRTLRKPTWACLRCSCFARCWCILSWKLAQKQQHHDPKLRSGISGCFCGSVPSLRSPVGVSLYTLITRYCLLRQP